MLRGRALAHPLLLLLIPTPERGTIRERHTRYYLLLAENIRPTLTGGERGQALAWLETEHNNLRAALLWTRDRGDGPLARRLAAALWRFWYLRGHLSEGRAWLAVALTLGGADAQLADLAARATAYHGAGVLAWTQGDDAQATALAEQALTIWQGLGDRAGSAAALNLLGLVAIDQASWVQAETAIEEGLALRRDLQDRWGIATSLHNLGTVARGHGDYERATALYAESLALRVVLADAAGIAISYRDQAVLATAQGDEPRVLALYSQSLAHANSLGDMVGVSRCLVGLAALAMRQGRPEPATRLLGAAAALREKVGAPVASDPDIAYPDQYGNPCFVRWVAGRRIRIVSPLGLIQHGL